MGSTPTVGMESIATWVAIGPENRDDSLTARGSTPLLSVRECDGNRHTSEAQTFRPVGSTPTARMESWRNGIAGAC